MILLLGGSPGFAGGCRRRRSGGRAARAGVRASAAGGVREVVLVRRPPVHRWQRLVEVHEAEFSRAAEQGADSNGGLMVGAETGEVVAVEHGGGEGGHVEDFDFVSVRSFASTEARLASNARLPRGRPWAGGGSEATLGCVYVPRNVVPFPLAGDAGSEVEAMRVIALVKFNEGSPTEPACKSYVDEVVAAMRRERPGALRGLEWGRQLGCGHGAELGTFANVMSPAYDFAVLATVVTEEDAHHLAFKLGGVPHCTGKDFGGGLRWMTVSFGSSSVCAVLRSAVYLPQPSALSLALRPHLDVCLHQVERLYGTISENDFI